MRIAFVKTLYEMVKRDKKIMLLTGDLGYSLLEQFMNDFPAQFLNMGVAEQNMIGVAAGFAIEGMIPVVYSIVPFATMRPFEQIRNDICYQNLNVKIVGVGAGFSYGPYGHTHHGLEDIGVLRTLPNLTIVAPADPVETALATRAMLAHKGSVYLRLGKAGEPKLYARKPVFTLGKGIILRKGGDLTIIATSIMGAYGIILADKLKEKGIDAQVVSMHTLKPIDSSFILQCAKKTKAIITIEEHSIIGGLGSAVAEVLAESGIPVRFKRIGVPDRFTKGMGLQEYMRELNGLAIGQLIQTTTTFLTL